MKLRTLGKVGHLSRAELWDLARAQVALVLAQVEVWLRPRGRLVLAAASAEQRQLPGEVSQRAERLSWAVTRVARYGVFRPECLTRSVALQRLLSRSGVPGSQIRIGVRPEPSGLAAHAWVTLNGMVIGDDPGFVGRYTPIADATGVTLR